MKEYEDIREYHIKCFNYLVQYQHEHKDCYFVPRKKNTFGRLDLNYYFIGNDTYLMITFWDGGDQNEKIHNINFGIEDDGHCFIEISSNDREERGMYLEKLVSILEKENKSKLKTDYRETRHHKWRRDYNNSGSDYIQVLQDFIDNDKPIIDKFIKQNPKCGIKLADEELYNKYVMKLLKSDESKDDIADNKSGRIWVDAHSYHMTLKHNELQNALIKYLIENDDYTNVEKEKNNVDITALYKSKKVFFELKTDTVKYSIREAIGQLLEYNHYPDKSNADKLIIVTKFKPTEEDKKYMKFIRERYNMPIYYQMFDMKENILSKEY